MMYCIFNISLFELKCSAADLVKIKLCNSRGNLLSNIFLETLQCVLTKMFIVLHLLRIIAENCTVNCTLSVASENLTSLPVICSFISSI